MKLTRSLVAALFSATLFATALAQTEADIASLREKATRGNSIAQYRLGLAYTNGNGIAADPIEAYIWLSLAYEGGFRGKTLGSVAGNLSPDQLTLARDRLAERRAQLKGQSFAATATKTEPAEADIPVVRTAPAAPAATLSPELEAALADKKQLSNELSQSWQETETLKKQLADTQASNELLATRADKTAAERDAVSVQLGKLEADLASLHRELEQTKLASSTPVYPDLSDRVKQLEATLAAAPTAPASAATPAYPDLSAKVAELEASLIALHRETTAAQQEAARLSDERLEREKQFVLLQQQTAQLNSAYTTLQAEATALRTATPAAPSYPDLSSKVAELESTLATLTTDATTAKQEAARFDETRRDLEKQNALLQQHAGELTKAHHALKQENESLRATTTAAQTPAYPDLREKVTALETTLAAAQNAAPSYPDLSGKVAELESALLTAKNAAPSYPDLSTRVTELESQLAAVRTAAPAYPDLRERVAELEAAVTALRTAPPAYPDLSTKVAELETQLAAATTATAPIAATTDTAELEALRAARTTAEERLATADQARTELTRQFDEFKRSALANQRQLLSAQSQVQMVESEKNTLRQQIDTDQSRLADLSSQLASAKRQLAEHYPTTPAYPDLRAKVEQLESELTKANEQSTGMINLLNRSQEEAKVAGAQLEKLRAEQKSFETKLAAAQKSGKSKTPAYPDLREKVAGLESALAAARSAAPAYPDLSAKVAELEGALAAVRSTASSPTYPDLSSRVAELETALTDAKNAKPAYPDLRAQVDDLEIRLAAAQALPAHMMPKTEYAKLKQEFDETQEKFATTLRGFSALERERDELARKLAATESRPPVSVVENETPASKPVVVAAPTRPATAPATVAAPTRPTPAPVVATAPSRPAAPAPTFTPTAAEIRKHLVVAGDSLSKLSQRYYGTPGRWREIYDANREFIASNGALRVGTELRIP